MKDHTINSGGVKYTFPIPETATEMVEFLGEDFAYRFMRRCFIDRIVQWIIIRTKRGYQLSQDDVAAYRPSRGINAEQLKGCYGRLRRKESEG